MSAYQELTATERQHIDQLEQELRTYRDSEGVAQRFRAKVTAWLAELEMAKNSADRIGLMDTVREIANKL